MLSPVSLVSPVLIVFMLSLSFIMSCTEETQTSPKVNTITLSSFPETGNPNGIATIPPEADLEDSSQPTTVIGNGTPQSCTSKAFVDAVAKGGVITFNCGNQLTTIKLEETAKIFNDSTKNILIDGNKKIALDGQGVRRILYMNTCDPKQHWTTSHCQNQDHPKLTLQNLAFINGNAMNESEYDGGGAIWVRGGRLKIVNSLFLNNYAHLAGPDVGGGALRVFSQHNNQPVYLTACTFGGKEEYANVASNGGAISSIGVSWTIINSLFSYNKAVGHGANPAKEGTSGGGSGGAIYNDGNTMTLTLLGSRLEHNTVNEHGASIFFVTNNHTGNIHIENSIIQNNKGGSWYPKYPSISMHADTAIEVIESTIE